MAERPARRWGSREGTGNRTCRPEALESAEYRAREWHYRAARELSSHRMLHAAMRGGKFDRHHAATLRSWPRVVWPGALPSARAIMHRGPPRQVPQRDDAKPKTPKGETGGLGNRLGRLLEPL